MAIIPGAKSRGPEHEAALDWAASLTRRVDTLDLDQLRAEWSSAEHTHRAQMKQTAPDALRQVWAYVRDRVDAIKG